jgi:regulator of nonsense transcripts 2
MEIEFAIQDAFAIVNPELKLATSLQEAGDALSEAVRLNYHVNSAEKSAELDEVDDEHISDDAAEDDQDDVDDNLDEETKTSPEDSEVSVSLPMISRDSYAIQDEDEDIESQSAEEDDQNEFNRQKDERDPEVDAEFDRELAKLMSDSMDSRKLERKTLFDVPLPMRKTQRQGDANISDDQQVELPVEGPRVVKFSLLTKRGNRQQVLQSFQPAIY